MQHVVCSTAMRKKGSAVERCLHRYMGLPQHTPQDTQWLLYVHLYVSCHSIRTSRESRSARLVQKSSFFFKLPQAICGYSSHAFCSVSLVWKDSDSSQMEAIPTDVWPGVLDLLSNCALCSLSRASKACWLVSCYKRTLAVKLYEDRQLHSRLVSLLYFLTSRREHLQVCCLQI